jgi:transcriptional regulator with XRE-family HTH domain
VTIGPKFRAGREIEAKTFGRHLQALRHHLLLNDKRLAERLGISPNAVRNWESGGALPSNENVQKVLAIAENEADPDWLLSGKGPTPRWLDENEMHVLRQLVGSQTAPTPAPAPPFDIKAYEHMAPIVVSVTGGRIVVSADPTSYRLEIIDGGVKIVRI